MTCLQKKCIVFWPYSGKLRWQIGHKPCCPLTRRSKQDKSTRWVIFGGLRSKMNVVLLVIKSGFRAEGCCMCAIKRFEVSINQVKCDLGNRGQDKSTVDRQRHSTKNDLPRTTQTAARQSVHTLQNHTQMPCKTKQKHNLLQVELSATGEVGGCYLTLGSRLRAQQLQQLGQKGRKVRGGGGACGN